MVKIRWLKQSRLEVAAELQQRWRRTNRRRKSIPRSSSSHREGSITQRGASCGRYDQRRRRSTPKTPRWTYVSSCVEGLSKVWRRSADKAAIRENTYVCILRLAISTHVYFAKKLIFLLILGPVFSDCVVFYEDIIFILSTAIVLEIILWFLFLPSTCAYQVKRAKYWMFHVIETTASILTKFGVTIETTNCHQDIGNHHDL